MAYDHSSTILHLTPDGWTHVERPADAVESWRCDTDQASEWSKEYVNWTCEWANPGVSREVRDAIRKKHQERMGKPGRWGDLITTIGDPL